MKCKPCKMNRRRVWISRLMLEARLHERKCWVTLTYDNDHVPSDMSVSPRDVQLFLKRLRKRVEPLTVRYFIVGEYGGRFQRPHYHAVLFGVDRVEDIQIAWGMGSVHFGLLSEASAGYTVGYLSKHMTAAGDPRLKGRHPEFARMSLRPGIGAGAVEVMAASYHTLEGCRALSRSGDVASEYRTYGEKWPLGRYLRGKLRVGVGFADAKEPPRSRESRLLDLQALLAIPGALAWHERRRSATAEKARSLMDIVESKKGD